MSETKFTPGPWVVKDDPPHAGDPLDLGGYQINTPHIEQLAYVWNQTNRRITGEPFGTVSARHDAALIAAAPDLYEALRDLCEIGGPDDGGCVIEKGLAALKKARGET